MKDAEILAKHYANALLNLSIKEKNLAEVEKAFDSFTNSAYKDPRFSVFMGSPVIPHDKKEALLEQILPANTPQILKLFLKLVLAKKRFEILRLIETRFQLLSEKSRGIRRAEFVSAAPVAAETEKNIILFLEKQLASASGPSSQGKVEVRLITKTDPELLGGFVLKFDESVIDASYKTKLRELRQKLDAATV
jgi:F-type H+-transporting ATPase subunit delta